MMNLLFSPNGRIDQPTYWRAVLIIAILSAVCSALGVFVSGVFGFLALVVMWNWIAVHAKRFHDNGKTGWYMVLLILVSGVVGMILGGILPGLFGFDMAAYNEDVSKTMQRGGDFAALMELINEAQRQTFVATILQTFIVTGILGAIMGLFKTDPNDNQYGPGPAGEKVAFN